MKKPTFKIALRDGSFIDQAYTPLIYTRMTSVFRFALYKSGRDWIVSEPVSGYRVCRVSAQFKGMPVASGHLTLRQARECALVDIDAIVDRIFLNPLDIGRFTHLHHGQAVPSMCR